MENVLFRLFGLPIYLYGFMVAVGLMFSTVLALREARRKGIGTPRMWDFVLGASFVYLLGGKLGTGFQIYGWALLTRPWLVLTHQGGINGPAGIASLTIFCIVFIIHHGLIAGVFLDALAPSLMLMNVFSALGSNVFGAYTEVPWAVVFGNIHVHPLPLYYALAFYVAFSYLWRRRKRTRFDGQLFLGAVVLGLWIHWALFPFGDNHFGVGLNRWVLFAPAVLGSVIWLLLLAGGQMPPTRRRAVNPLAFLADLLFLGLSILAMITAFYWRLP